MPDIDFQKIVLNLIPKKGDEPVIFYASQYETTRPFIADLMWGDSEFAPGVDCWAEIDIRKNDDNLVVITEDVAIDNNEVSVILPVQAVTCIGKNLGQVKIYAGEDQLIAALNFILEVQADPLAGGVTSETAIDNLTQQIEEITQQVIGDDYYNKTEVDDLLDDKADKATTYTKSEVDSALALKADKSDTYTKTQVDNALALKADASNVYTKSQIDTALALKADTTYVDSGLALKANAADVYTKAQTYSQAEVDALIDNIFPTLTASGDIASFTTALTKPLVSVTTDPLATTVTRRGINIWDEEYERGYYDASGNIVPSTTQICSKNKIRVSPNTTYYFHYGEYKAGRFCYYDVNGNFIERSSIVSPITDTAFVVPNDVYYINFHMDYTTDYNNDVSINYPATETSYHAYTGDTVPVADATTLVTQSGVNYVFADVGDVTVQYKYMSL